MLCWGQQLLRRRGIHEDACPLRRVHALSCLVLLAFTLITSHYVTCMICTLGFNSLKNGDLSNNWMPCPFSVHYLNQRGKTYAIA